VAPQSSSLKSGLLFHSDKFLLFSRIKSRYTYLHIATKVENNFYGFQLYRSWRIEILDLECVLMKSFQPLFSEFWRALEFFLSWLCTSFWFLSWNDFILHPLQFASQYGPVLDVHCSNLKFEWIIVECFGICSHGTSITFLSSYLEFGIWNFKFISSFTMTLNLIAHEFFGRAEYLWA
jgi:hypothetical protein